MKKVNSVKPKIIKPPNKIPPIEKIKERIKDVFTSLVALKTHLRCKIKLRTMPLDALIKCAVTGIKILRSAVYKAKSTKVATSEVLKNLTIFNVHCLNRIAFFLLSFFIMNNQF